MCKRDDTVSVVLAKPDYRGCPTASVDTCIAPIVRALNDAGILTVASCCGHGIRPGNIALKDGRELVVASDYETGRRVDAAFPPLSAE